MKLVKEFLLVLCLSIASIKCDITDKEYGLMPELFYLDNFDQCMLDAEKGTFCTFIYSLEPVGDNLTVWNITQTISTNPQNYRHDLLRHGICLAQTCQHPYGQNESTEEKIRICYDQKYKFLALRGNVTNVACHGGKTKYSVDIYDLVIGIILLVYILLVLLASLYEIRLLCAEKPIYYERSSSKVGLILTAFSVPTNWQRLTTLKSSSDYKKLKGIQGIRFYNMVCVIITHTIICFLSGPISNTKFSENLTRGVHNMPIANGWFIVQTFFVISGWLMSYQFFNVIEKSNIFGCKYMLIAIFNRYVRLIPPVAFMIAIHGTWLVHASSGPYWDAVIRKEYRNCRENWWTNILFVNNYVNKNNMCLFQTWYISSDMQLFLFSLPILWLVWKYPSKVKLIFGQVLLVGFLFPGILAYVNNYDIIIRQYPEKIYDLKVLELDEWHSLVTSAYSNIFGYAIGIVFGYIFVKSKNQNLTVKKIHLLFWFIFSFGMCTFIVLIASQFYDPHYEVTPLKSALYWSFGKNLFALGIAIGILGFTQKIGGIIRLLCEFQPIQVLGRLTYSTYIIHMTFIKFQMGYRRYPLSLNYYMLVISVLGNVICAYLGGTILCLFVEMPVSALQKRIRLLLHPPISRPKKYSEKSLETLDLASSHVQENSA